MKAVITGDLIGSSKYNFENRELIINTLNNAIHYLGENHECKYSLFRGDSLQGILDDTRQSLWHVIYIKASLKQLRFTKTSRSSKADIRISIGIGDVSFTRERLEESDGEAFQLSGRGLDKMKGSGRTITINSNNLQFDKEWQVILGLLDVLLDKWSVSSAETALELMMEQNEKEISKKLNISQPAVSLRKKYAGWEVIRETLELFDIMVAKQFNK